MLFGMLTANFAQENFIATLQHGNSYSYYYTISALENAYNAAVDGDIITLSAGTFSFSSKNFSKRIILRGNGIDTDAQTIITDNINFYCKDKNLTLTIEGITFVATTAIPNSLSDKGQGKINFLKCSFNDVKANASSSYSEEVGPIVQFRNCILSNMYFDYTSHPYFTFVNCYVKDPTSNGSIGSNLSSFQNCVIRYTGGYYSKSRYADYLSFNNCIFVCDSDAANSNYGLPGTAIANSCLSTGGFTHFFDNLIDKNTNKNTTNTVFKTYNGDYIKGETFELTETAKKTYLGNDGTQIGMQGGLYPYSSTVQYPIITKLNADKKTTKEGLLNVEIEIDGK